MTPTIVPIRVVSKLDNGNREYEKLKKRLRKSTASYGAVLSTASFITQGSDKGLSMTLGVLTSYTYLSSLEKYVDDIETSGFPNQFLVPVSIAAFEVIWNSAPFSFDFDYGSTFIGFLSYKFAIINVLYETVKDWLISDSTNLYRIYTNNENEDDEQHGEVPIIEK